MSIVSSYFLSSRMYCFPFSQSEWWPSPKNVSKLCLWYCVIHLRWYFFIHNIHNDLQMRNIISNNCYILLMDKYFLHVFQSFVALDQNSLILCLDKFWCSFFLIYFINVYIMFYNVMQYIIIIICCLYLFILWDCICM